MDNVVQYAGPWKGMEQRETYQTDAHCELALNVTFHRGYIEGRKGFKTATSIGIVTSDMFIGHRPVGPPRLLCVGVTTTSFHPTVVIRDLDLGAIGSVNLNTSFGEPADQFWTCSFHRATLGSGHAVVIITTPYQSFIWDPSVDETTVRKVAMATDTVKIDAVNWFYVSQSMKGPIVETHQKRTYYAGFLPQTEIGLDGALPVTQQDVPETWVIPGRDAFRIGPHVVAYSDVLFPFDIHATAFFTVSENERVTGLKSFREQLVVFTDQGIYLLVGDPSIYGQGAQFLRAVTGSGCVAPKSIEEVNGILYYVGLDGIYTYDGQTATKISGPIDALWSGTPTTSRMPAEVATLMEQQQGWPWRINAGRLQLAQATHCRSQGQVWFALAVHNRQQPYSILGLTLVWDYIHQAWSVFRKGSDLDFSTAAVSYVENGRERFYMSQLTSVAEYGTADTDAGAAIPTVYVSARHAKGNDEQAVFRRLRLNMLSWGKTPSVSPPRWFIDSELSAFDGQLYGVVNTNRTQTSGDIELHPCGLKSPATMDPPGNPNNTYFCGTAKTGPTGDARTTTRSWWTQVVHPNNINARWWRWGFVDNSQQRPPSVVVQSYSMEQHGTKALRT